MNRAIDYGKDSSMETCIRLDLGLSLFLYPKCRQNTYLRQYCKQAYDMQMEASMNKVLGNKKAIALFVIPGLILYVGLVFVPVIWSFVYSFYDGTPGLNWSFSGLKNYSRFANWESV